MDSAIEYLAVYSTGWVYQGELLELGPWRGVDEYISLRIFISSSIQGATPSKASRVLFQQDQSKPYTTHQSVNQK